VRGSAVVDLVTSDAYCSVVDMVAADHPAGFVHRDVKPADPTLAGDGPALPLDLQTPAASPSFEGRPPGLYCAVYPPSITRLAPVMNEDSSDARNSTPFAISSAVPRRPTGTRSAMLR
jgi:serine/threonine protein kinase